MRANLLALSGTQRTATSVRWYAVFQQEIVECHHAIRRVLAAARKKPLAVVRPPG